MRDTRAPSRRRPGLCLAGAAGTIALLLACDGGPFEIEPRQLAGEWAGSSGRVDVLLTCAEEGSTSHSPLGGPPATGYGLACRGSFRDAGRGVASTQVHGGSAANSRASQRVEFSFSVSTDLRPPEGGFVYYRFLGRATDRTTIEGSLALEGRRSTVFPDGTVGGPEIVTRMDSLPLTLRRR